MREKKHINNGLSHVINSLFNGIVIVYIIVNRMQCRKKVESVVKMFVCS